jgi:hypothetical protein
MPFLQILTHFFKVASSFIIHVSCAHFLFSFSFSFLFFSQISFFLSSYVIPLTLISILYVGMLIRLWHSVPGSKVSAESRRGKKRVTRMVVFVVLAFAICWLPIHVSMKFYLWHRRHLGHLLIFNLQWIIKICDHQKKINCLWPYFSFIRVCVWMARIQLSRNN